MKIYLLGNDRTIPPLFEALAGRGTDLFVISSDSSSGRDIPDRSAQRIQADPLKLDLTSLSTPPGPDDLVIVAEQQEARLQQILMHLHETRIPAAVLAFTSPRGKRLARAYPQIAFKTDREIFRRELKELVRRNTTVRLAEQLRTIVKSKPKLLILIWGNPDPDSLGSAAALSDFVRDDAKQCTLAYTGKFTRSENAAMAKILKIPAIPFERKMLDPETTLATVDAQPSFFQPILNHPFDIIIDHHPPTDLGSPPFVDVRAEYGSTSSILTEYYMHTQRAIPRPIATGLFYGLKVDTASLTRHVCDADVEAFGELRTRADHDALRMIELSHMPLSMLDAFSIAISNRKIGRQVIFSYIGAVENPDTGVTIADFLVQVSEITWVVTACRTTEKLIVIFRTDGHGRHAGEVAEACFHEFGTAGGHRTMARAELDPGKVLSDGGGTDDATLEQWLLRKLSDQLRSLKKFVKETSVKS